MATAALMRQLYVRLGFTNAMATAITDTQGIDDVEELGNLFDDDVERLCKALKSPGGTVPNPNAGARGAPANIPNPGFNVPVKGEQNLKLTAYYVRHRGRISRPVVIPEITSALVRGFKNLKETEEDHKDPTDKPTINERNWVKTLEEIEEFLRNHLGHHKTPLSYVVRKDIEVPPHANYPQGNYLIVQDEMVRHAPHLDENGNLTDIYNMDNCRVWTLILDLTRDHNALHTSSLINGLGMAEKAFLL